MNEVSFNPLIDKINSVLTSKKDCVINIVNDKLLFSVVRNYRTTENNFCNISTVR